MAARVAILASGSGSTAEAFIRAAEAGVVDAAVVLVICNKPQAGIFERVDRLNQELGLDIKTELINSHLYPAAENETLVPGGQTSAEEAAIGKLLQANAIELVLLMGYLRRVGPKLVYDYGWQPDYQSPYQARMLNTHPGLLPATKGLWGIHVQEHVIKQRLPFGGQTLHVVAEDYDDGPILAEHQVAVEPDDTAKTFFDRVQIAEKTNLPLDVQQFLQARQQHKEEHA